MNETTPHLSIFKSARAIVPAESVTVAEAVELIRSDRLKADIERLRGCLTAGNRAAYDQGKKDLPAVTWSGTFKARNKAGLVDPSGLLVVDLDHLGDKMPAVRAALTIDPAVAVCFTSPSGDGLKAVAAVSDSSDHGRAWRAVADRVKAETGIEPDPSGKDVSRLCFLSHDPNAYHNPAPVPVVVPPEAPKAEQPRSTATISSTTRANKYARGALEKAVAAVVQACDGSRNQTLNDEAHSLGQLIGGGALDEAEAREALRRAAIGAGLSDDEIRKTIESGIEAGKAKPRGVPESKTEPAGANGQPENQPDNHRNQPRPEPAMLYGL
ncbi:MAG TPA: BT4734/BF3469 family protein, partial [Candidatus Ozemobacteraceae bacterium]|nr:BT4734/BF3469 family protein [Candidatus Ozemobacteraceae bacterium]